MLNHLLQHQPGRITSEADKHEEFHAETLPAGSAPASKTFKPNNISEVPPMKDYSADAEPETSENSAQATMPGATSGDVHQGLGRPVQGQSSSELRHDAKAGSSGGLEGVGASGVKSANLVDARDPEFAQSNRALEKEDAKISGRNETGGAAAEDRVPSSA